MGVHVSPILNPLSPSHPSGSSQCSRLEHPVSCIKAGLAIYFIYGNILFQCYSLKSSHPCLLPQSPKVCSLYLCLFCCLTYRAIITIFLKFHIYVLIYYNGVFLSGLLHSIIGSSFIHLIRTDSNV